MSLVKVSALVLALMGSCIARAQVSVSIDPKQILGVWQCTANIPTTSSGVSTSVSGRAVYAVDGTATHHEQVNQTLLGGEHFAAIADVTTKWRFDEKMNRLYEKLESAKLVYDKVNPTSAKIGADLERGYLSAIGVEHSTQTMRLTDKEWLSMVGYGQNIAATCQRGI